MVVKTNNKTDRNKTKGHLCAIVATATVVGPAHHGPFPFSYTSKEVEDMAWQPSDGAMAGWPPRRLHRPIKTSTETLGPVSIVPRSIPIGPLPLWIESSS